MSQPALQIERIKRADEDLAGEVDLDFDPEVVRCVGAREEVEAGQARGMAAVWR